MQNTLYVFMFVFVQLVKTLLNKAIKIRESH